MCDCQVFTIVVHLVKVYYNTLQQFYRNVRLSYETTITSLRFVEWKEIIKRQSSTVEMYVT